MYRYLMTFLFLCLFGVIGQPSAEALPRNFRNVDTFFVGGMPTVEDLEEFQTLGIKTIISLHKLPSRVERKAREMGMTLYSYPLRTRLVGVDEIMAVLRSSPQNTVYLHCLHGADRTGAVTAYWLSKERHMDPFAALVSVISPKDYHIRGLLQLGQEYGVCLYNVPPYWVGRYSGARNGGLEGLKICGGEWYTKLARNYLSVTMGEPINHRNETFWKDHSGVE